MMFGQCRADRVIARRRSDPCPRHDLPARAVALLLLTGPAGCGAPAATGPHSTVDRKHDVGITNVRLADYPPDVPTNAELTFFGRPGETFPVRETPLGEPGTLFVYDDTAGRLVRTVPMDPAHPAVEGDPLPEGHEYRGFFLPARLSPRFGGPSDYASHSNPNK